MHARCIPKTVNKTITDLQDRIYDRWDEEILDNKKLAVYAAIKDSYNIDKYTTAINDRHLRKYLTCLRLGCHSLQIEVGRYKNIPRENRMCTLCKHRNVEDECNFLLTCPLYSTLRDELFNSPLLSNINMKTPSSEKLKYILQPESVDVAILVCKYIKNCLEKRKGYLNQTL